MTDGLYLLDLPFMVCLRRGFSLEDVHTTTLTVPLRRTIEGKQRIGAFPGPENELRRRHLICGMCG